MMTDILDDARFHCVVWNYSDITEEKMHAPSLVPY